MGNQQDECRRVDENNFREKEYLTVVSLNINSIRNKSAEFSILLSEIGKPDILCLTEHHLRPQETVVLDDYNVISCFTRNRFKRGGTIILGKSSTSFINVDKYDSLNSEKDFELTCAFSKILHIYIINVYRAPSGDFNVFCQNLSQVLDSLPKNSRLVLVGDFNVDANQDSQQYHAIKLIFLSFNLKSHVSSFTRITKNTATTIDYFCTNFKNGLVDVDTRHTDLSDHELLIGKIKIAEIKRRKESIIVLRNFSNKNITKFIGLINSTDWIFLRDPVTSSEKFSLFYNYIKNTVNLCFPYKKIVNNRKEYITPGIRISCKNKRCLSYISKFTNNQNFIQYFKNYKYILTSYTIGKKQILL